MWGFTCSNQVVQAGAVHHTLLAAPALCRDPYCLELGCPVWCGRAMPNLRLCHELHPPLTSLNTRKAELGKRQVLGHRGLPSENVLHHGNGAITCWTFCMCLPFCLFF